MDITTLKDKLADDGYVNHTNSIYKNICDIWVKDDGRDIAFVVIFERDTVVSSYKDIKNMDERIRNRNGILIGKHGQDHILNIVKCNERSLAGKYNGDNTIVVLPGEYRSGRIDRIYHEIIDGIKAEKRVDVLTQKKLDSVKGTIFTEDRTAIVTYILIAVCVLCYIKYWRYASTWAISPQALQNGAWLKLISSMLMHGSILHIFANMAALLSYGRALESREGHISMLITYMLGGISSMFMTAFISLVNGNINASTVGASGAIYAILGAFIVSEMMMPKGIRNAKKLIGSVAYMLLMGAVMPNVDNTCHVAGLVSGIIIMLIIKVIKRSYHEVEYAKCANELRKYGKDFIIPGKVMW